MKRDEVTKMSLVISRLVNLVPVIGASILDFHLSNLNYFQVLIGQVLARLIPLRRVVYLENKNPPVYDLAVIKEILFRRHDANSYPGEKIEKILQECRALLKKKPTDYRLSIIKKNAPNSDSTKIKIINNPHDFSVALDLLIKSSGKNYQKLSLSLSEIKGMATEKINEINRIQYIIHSEFLKPACQIDFLIQCLKDFLISIENNVNSWGLPDDEITMEIEAYRDPISPNTLCKGYLPENKTIRLYLDLISECFGIKIINNIPNKLLEEICYKKSSERRNYDLNDIKLAIINSRSISDEKFVRPGILEILDIILDALIKHTYFKKFNINDNLEYENLLHDVLEELFDDTVKKTITFSCSDYITGPNYQNKIYIKFDFTNLDEKIIIFVSDKTIASARVIDMSPFEK